MIRVRSAWDRSPCRQSTLKFSRASWLASMPVLYLVLQKTITRLYPSEMMIWARSASLSRPVVSSLYWSILGLESSTGCTLTSAAFFWYSQPMSSTSRLMVAENMDRLLRCFIRSMMWRTSL